MLRLHTHSETFSSEGSPPYALWTLFCSTAVEITLSPSSVKAFSATLLSPLLVPFFKLTTSTTSSKSLRHVVNVESRASSKWLQRVFNVASKTSSKLLEHVLNVASRASSTLLQHVLIVAFWASERFPRYFDMLSTIDSRASSKLLQHFLTTWHQGRGPKNVMAPPNPINLYIYI